EAVRQSGEPFEHAVALVAAFGGFFEFKLVIDVQRPDEPVLQPVFLEDNFPLELRFLVTNARLKIERQANGSLVRTQQSINSFERNRFKMITVERFGRIVSRVRVFAAGFVNASQAFSGTRGIFSRNVVVCIDVVMVEIESELEIVGHAVFELWAES